MALLIGLLTFLVVLVVFVGIWMIAGRDERGATVRRRIEAVGSAEKRGEVSGDLKLVRDELYSNVPQLHKLLLRLPWSSGFQKFITQAGSKIKAGKVVLSSAVAGLGTYLAVGLFYPHQTFLPIVSGLLATGVPFGTLAFMRQRRLRQFEEYFPDTLDLIGRAVRAGHAFTTGLEMVSKEASEPVAGEFRTAFEEQNFGLPLRDALLNLAQRVPLVDVRLFVTALLVQKETGGNLAELLDELARLMRERFRICREIKVRTAQGRLTAGILIALPIFMLIVMDFLNPDYVGVLFTDPVGPTLLLAAGFLQVVGSAIIWKIVHIEV